MFSKILLTSLIIGALSVNALSVPVAREPFKGMPRPPSKPTVRRPKREPGERSMLPQLHLMVVSTPPIDDDSFWLNAREPVKGEFPMRVGVNPTLTRPRHAEAKAKAHCPQAEARTGWVPSVLDSILVGI